jgi:ABC-type antimicrobial peptide transport system permease subunit
MRPVVAGAALGTVVGGAVARLLAGLLYGVSPGDPANYLWTLGALLAAGLLASAGPAVRAARTHPAVALRSE